MAVCWHALCFMVPSATQPEFMAAHFGLPVGVLFAITLASLSTLYVRNLSEAGFDHALSNSHSSGSFNLEILVPHGLSAPETIPACMSSSQIPRNGIFRI